MLTRRYTGNHESDVSLAASVKSSAVLMTDTPVRSSNRNFRNSSLLLSRFIRRQAGDMQEAGFPVLLRKALVALGIGLAVFPVLLVRVLRPMVLVRFGWLRSDRIGHFAADTEFYLCERDVGMQNPRAVDIFYYSAPACNQQLKKMFDRTLRTTRFARSLVRCNLMLPGGEKHTIAITSRDVYHTRDVCGVLARTQAHISFTPDEEHLGHMALRELSIPEGTPFVCFIVRDSAYLKAALPDSNWDYHSYRDSSIHNCVPAAEELGSRGYFSIRMGAAVKEALNTTNPMIVDYGTNSRTDFLDIYLSAKCRFFISSGTGIDAIPMIFRRPIIYVNYVPLEYVQAWGPDYLFIPKELWLREEHRFLTFREILESGAGRFLRTDQYEQLNIEVVEDTSEEITAVTIEMDERLKGTWQTTEEDEELQRQFWALFKPSELNKVFLSRIGAEFLRQNRELLPERAK